jgi:uncharacterized protein
MSTNLNKATLVLGASDKAERYAYKAIKRLRLHGIDVFACGLKNGKVSDVEFETTWNPNWQVDTVTLYINPMRQQAYYENIIALKPKRVIFNPGTENQEFQRLLKQNNIYFEEACTLVLLSIGQY